MDKTITLMVNGKERSVTTDTRRPLLDVLREDLHLTGTKYGCGEGQCQACTVLIDNKPVQTCTYPAILAEKKSITTIEGLAKGDQLHPVQQAFMDEEAMQCGFCVAGMIMGTVGFLAENPNPTDEEIREGMNGHICRCCGYNNLVKAIRRAAKLSKEVVGV